MNKEITIRARTNLIQPGVWLNKENKIIARSAKEGSACRMNVRRSRRGEDPVPSSAGEKRGGRAAPDLRKRGSPEGGRMLFTARCWGVAAWGAERGEFPKGGFDPSFLSFFGRSKKALFLWLPSREFVSVGCSSRSISVR